MCDVEKASGRVLLSDLGVPRQRKLVCIALFVALLPFAIMRSYLFYTSSNVPSENNGFFQGQRAPESLNYNPSGVRLSSLPLQFSSFIHAGHSIHMTNFVPAFLSLIRCFNDRRMSQNRPMSWTLLTTAAAVPKLTTTQRGLEMKWMDLNPLFLEEKIAIRLL